MKAASNNLANASTCERSRSTSAAGRFLRVARISTSRSCRRPARLPRRAQIDAEECLGIRKRPGPKLSKTLSGLGIRGGFQVARDGRRRRTQDQSRAGGVHGVGERDRRVEGRHVRTGDRSGRDLRPAVVPFLIERREGEHGAQGVFDRGRGGDAAATGCVRRLGRPFADWRRAPEQTDAKKRRRGAVPLGPAFEALSGGAST